jgi:hypothetical protein
MNSIGASISYFGEGPILGLTIAVIILLSVAQRRRRRELEGIKTSGVRPVAMEVVAFLLAMVVVEHVAVLVSVVFGVVFGLLFGVSVCSTISGKPHGAFKSFYQSILDMWCSPPIAIAAVLGFILGLLYGTVGGGILLAFGAMAIVVGRRARVDFQLAQSAQDSVAVSVASCLGISVEALNDLAWNVTDGTIVVSRPGPALLNADRIAERVATLMPGLEVTEMSPAQIVLSPLSEAGAVARHNTQLSGGLITGASDASAPTPFVAPKTPDPVVPEYVINAEDL